ncbi:MAG: hypothetical protein R3B47_14360 [Bacteroidia bacterium]
MLHQALASTGNYREAYEAFALFKELEDSLMVHRNDELVHALQVEFETEKILQQKLSLDKENSLLRTRGRLTALAVLLLIGLLLLGLWPLTKAKKRHYFFPKSRPRTRQ